MIRVLDDMPAGVLGFEAVDDVEEEDYANVLVPAIEQAIAEFEKVRIVYVLGPEFDEYEGDAAWEDLKLCAPPGVVRADGHRHGRKLGGSGGQGLQHPVARPSARVCWAPSRALGGG